MSSAPFVVLEGLDGVGKSTVARDLADALGGVVDDTPGPALRPLRDAVLDALSDETARCLFYAATVIARGDSARAAALAGRAVVMDRYWLSTACYARARGVTLDLDAIAAAVPPPDVTVWLTLDEAERRRRLAARGATTADRETLCPAFRDAVLASARRMPGPGVDVWVDLTGAHATEAVARVATAVHAHMRSLRHPR